MDKSRELSKFKPLRKASCLPLIQPHYLPPGQDSALHCPKDFFSWCSRTNTEMSDRKSINSDEVPVGSASAGGTWSPVSPLSEIVLTLFSHALALRKLCNAGGNVIEYPVKESPSRRIRIPHYHGVASGSFGARCPLKMGGDVPSVACVLCGNKLPFLERPACHMKGIHAGIQKRHEY